VASLPRAALFRSCRVCSDWHCCEPFLFYVRFCRIVIVVFLFVVILFFSLDRSSAAASQVMGGASHQCAQHGASGAEDQRRLPRPARYDEAEAEERWHRAFDVLFVSLLGCFVNELLVLVGMVSRCNVG
jgi:hypothetical protein